MRTSDHGLQLLKQWEGFKTKMYKDAAGLLTIGVGHLLKKDELASCTITILGVPVKYADGLSEEQVIALLGQDLEPAENAVKSDVKSELNQNQFDALVAFTFNVGTNAFADSTLLKMLNQGNYDAVPEQFRRWTKAGGKVIPGLVNRRENEIKLWLGQI